MRARWRGWVTSLRYGLEQPEILHIPGTNLDRVDVFRDKGKLLLPPHLRSAKFHVCCRCPESGTILNRARPFDHDENTTTETNACNVDARARTFALDRLVFTSLSSKVKIAGIPTIFYNVRLVRRNYRHIIMTPTTKCAIQADSLGEHYQALAALSIEAKCKKFLAIVSPCSLKIDSG